MFWMASHKYVTVVSHIRTRTLQARTNIPALSDRTLRRDVVASGFTTGAEIQVNLYIIYSLYIISRF